MMHLGNGDVENSLFNKCTPCSDKTKPLHYLYHIFAKLWRISKVLSPIDSGENLPHNYR